jgi:hypothetical protein
VITRSAPTGTALLIETPELIGRIPASANAEATARESVQPIDARLQQLVSPGRLTVRTE